jgi:hypothetical protein
MGSPLRTGGALALTVALGYSACALVFWLLPHAAATFMNSLFHGLDFAKLQTETDAFRFDGFAGALAVITIWAFFLGTVFSFINERFRAP